MPSASESGGIGVGVSGKPGFTVTRHMLKTKEPFCVEVEWETFISLHSILSYVKGQISSINKAEEKESASTNGPFSDVSKPKLDYHDMMWIIVHCLRILKVPNLSRVVIANIF